MGKDDWKKEMAPHVTASGGSQAGFQSKLGVIRRPARSYRMEREAQLMRQMSSRLFLHAAAKAKKKDRPNPVEVEMMFVKGNLFIGANEDTAAETIFKTLQSSAATRRALVERSHFKTLTSAGGRIEARHKAKLTHRVFDDARRDAWLKEKKISELDRKSRQRAALIGKLVRTIAPEMLSVDSAKRIQSAFDEPGGVYVLHGGKQGRHVEEKFMDVLETAGYQGGAIVAGKMRPCLTCSGRMDHMDSEGYQVKFNPHPGKVWISRFEDQPAPVRKHTVKLAKTKRTSISVAGPGWGSESESDDDMGGP